MANEVLSPNNTIIKPATADDINDLLNADDDKEPTKPVKEVEPPKKAKEEPEEEDEDREDKEDEEDEDLDLVEPEDEEEAEKLDLEEPTEEVVPPRKKEILKAYPELFKKFPYLEKMMYRDRQYTELFGSFDDAREAAERIENFGTIEKSLLAGDTSELLKEVKETDEKAYNIIIDDYLPTLYKFDKDAYFHVLGNHNRKLIMEMVGEADRSKNDDLKTAAVLLHQFLFGSSEFTPPKMRVAKRGEGESEEDSEIAAYAKERFETARDEVQSRVDNTLRATISEYIDPRGQMTSYVKKNAIADAMRMLQRAIDKDPAVIKNLDRLWRAAGEEKFSKDSLGKAQSYYLSRARPLIKSVIMKARAEALKDTSPKREKETEEETSPTRRTIPTGRTSQPKKNEMRKGESVQDFFARD